MFAVEICLNKFLLLFLSTETKAKHPRRVELVFGWGRLKELRRFRRQWTCRRTFLLKRKLSSRRYAFDDCFESRSQEHACVKEQKARRRETYDHH